MNDVPLSNLLRPDIDVGDLVWLNPVKLARSAREGNMFDEPLTHPFIEAVKSMSEDNYQFWLVDLERENKRLHG